MKNNQTETNEGKPVAQKINSIATLADTDITAIKRIEGLLDDGGQTQALRKTLFAIVALVAIFIVWSLMTKVDELARARGEVKPAGRVQMLQIAEGGRITKLHVQEGDEVKMGEAIAEFSAIDLVKDLAQINIRINSAAIDRERLTALLENRKPDFSMFQNDFPLLVEEAMAIYTNQVANREATITAKTSSGSQQRSLLEGLESQKESLAEELTQARDVLQKYEEAAEKGLIPQVQLSESKQKVSELESRQAELDSRINGMTSTIEGADAEVEQSSARIKQELSAQLSQITEQYREFVEERKALEDRAGQVVLTAPTDGIIMDLPETTEGAILAPGGVVAKIVPSDQELLLEAWVAPRDIGFVEAGQSVTVKIDSFDSARFGSIKGVVRRVAPTTTKQGEAQAPFYKVEITLASNFVGKQSHRLIPGMTGEADIATGRKSVMQFLLKPVFTAADTAFHER